MKPLSMIIMVSCTLTVTGCAGSSPTSQSPSSTTAAVRPTLASDGAMNRPGGAPISEQVTFFDAGSFDSELSKALGRGGSELTVNSVAPFSVNNIPPRLAKWFTAITDSGGSVRAQRVAPVEQTADANRAGLPGIGNIFDIVLAAYDYIQEAMLYAPVKRYDAMVWVSQNGSVERVSFLKRL